jgi:ferritin-like metal-binding protein YciE
MERGSLRGFYVSELKKCHDSESQLAAALETAAKASSSPELRSGFENHLHETRDHAALIQMILETLGERLPEPEQSKQAKCVGMRALISDLEELMEGDLAGNALDCALVAYGQRIEHYEIATYGTLRDYATALGDRDTASQLQNTLEEEQEIDRLLTQIGQAINAELAREESSGAETPQPAVDHEPKTRIKPAA